MIKSQSDTPSFQVGISEQRIRDFLNQPRWRDLIYKDRSVWNGVWAALDVIGDTEAALDSYLGMQETSDVGEQYIRIYGVMQVLVTQQDAVAVLSRSLKIPLDKSADLKEIREDRALSAGHPAETRSKARGGISRVSMSRDRFDLHVYYDDERRHEHRIINLVDHINSQRALIAGYLNTIFEKLRADENAYRKRFWAKGMSEIFKGIEYCMRKVIEGVHSPDMFVAGENHIEMVESALNKFTDELASRGLQKSHRWFCENANEIRYALSRLRTHFRGLSPDGFDQKDADIYAFYAQSRLRDLIEEIERMDQEFKNPL